MSQDNKPINDKIDGETAVARAYRQLQQAEPSSELDKAILEAAHAEAGPRKKGPGLNPFSRHWFVPASLAAVLVLTVGIVLTLEKETGTELYEVDRTHPQATEPQPKVTPAPAAKTRAISREQNEVRQKATPEAGLHAPLPDTQRSAEPATPLKEEKNIEASPAPAMTQEPAAAVRKPMPEAAQDLSPPSAVEGLKREAVPATAAPAPVAPVPAPDAAGAQEEAEPPLRKPEPESGAVGEEAQEPTPARDAEAWLAEIRQLIQQDKANEARQQLNEFVRAYPEYPLDEELSALAQ